MSEHGNAITLTPEQSKRAIETLWDDLSARENAEMRAAIKEAQCAVSAFLGFHSGHLSNAQVASLSETLTKLQPFLK
jgi:hypothetical protein